MEQNRDYEEMEVDLSQYIKVVLKRKKTFLAVFFLSLAIGIIYALFSLKIYTISMMIQPPVIGPSLTGANDYESAENLKGLIMSGAFDDELKRKLNLNFDIKFKVAIPNKTNILQVSIDLQDKKKELGIDLLQSLNRLISEKFAKGIEAKITDILNQIKLNEHLIINAKEKAKSLEEQIKETSLREEKLSKELKTATLITAQIWEKRDLYLKESAPSGNSSALFFASYLQNSSNYLNHLNNQFSDLAIRKTNLSLELKNIESQITNFQIEVDKLNINKNFISNLKIITQPKISSGPISPNRWKTLVISIALGLFLGTLAIFLQEFWANNLAKK